MDASAIVLAGGRSSRFGRDKLAEPIDGMPLLHHAVAAVAGVCAEVVVVRRPRDGEPPRDGVVPLPADVPLSAGLGVPLLIANDPEAFGGPLVGLLAGARRATRPHILVVGGDMPDLVQAVLELLLGHLAAGSADAVVLSRDRPLPMAARRAAVLDSVAALLDAGTRSLRSFIEHVDAVVLPEATWRAVDKSGASLHDVDRPEDLDRVGRGP
jgi:molybdopterin-guanine dinucleotide biosynthesis protein A